ncbi:hypothetical protein LCGC14_1251470 [marine sediment metagenome]|uniref:SF4 helicase domain-containing protein n=1 Tax=marine sediment metagenome TaxID=412755 RepID=A0A0F9LPN9_9ZZZZ
MSTTISRPDIKNWIETMPEGDFHYKDIMGLRPILTPELDTALRRIVYDFSHGDNQICESTGKGDGRYRRIDNLPEPEDWQNTDATKDFPIVLPFDLRKYAWIDPETHIIITGSKDSGKTGYIMRAVGMNMNIINTVFLTNMEGGRNQLKRRFDAMNINIPNPPPFKTWFKTDNFHDYMKEPDTFYAIDYIDVPESGEFYMIAPAIARIQAKLQKLGNCVAMIGLQKKMNSDIAYGGEQTLKKASLYIAMNPGKLKIVSAKIHADPKINPKNMQWTFIYSDEGTNFLNITPCYEEE